MQEMPGDMGSIPGSGRFPAARNGKPLWYSCQGNIMARGLWGCKELDTTLQLNNNKPKTKRETLNKLKNSVKFKENKSKSMGNDIFC